MRRRLFGAVLTAAMLVSLVPALPTAAAVTQLTKPTVEWVTGTKTFGDRTFQNGQVVLTDIPESMPNYRVEIKDAAGNIFDQYEDGFGGGSRTVQEIWVGWYTEAVMPSGTYTASVTYLGDNGVTYTDSETATTQPYTYTAPGASYAVPTGVAWNGANFSYTVEEAAQNQSLFMEFAKVQEDGTYSRIGMRGDSVQYAQQTNNASFLERLNERVNRYGPGKYVFRIRVISQDITAKWHSDWSDWSAPRSISGADEDLTGSLNGIIQNLEQNPDNKQTAVNAVQALDQEKLLQELSADQDGTGVAGQLADLEQKLGLTATVELAENSGLSLDTSKVQVVGAGLNAQNLTAPTFTIDKPAADLEIPNTYKNTVQLDFSLPGAATNQDGTLKVPIQITMPVPADIDPAKLRILHYKDGNLTETITPYTFQENGKWMVRFTVNHLSPFVFAEEQSANSEAAITVEGTTTYYDTLTQALSAAQSGQTVTLLKDIDNSVGKAGYTGGINYSLKAGTILDGGGHTISGHVGVHIPAAGAAVQNVKFLNIHNNTKVDQDTCDYYGWDSKTGNQSAIYASKLTGTATITGCTFDNIDWDAIQITPAATTAEIVIKNNVFRHTASTGTQLRYVHVEHDLAIFSGSKINELTITDNQFYDTENPNSTICSVGVWYVNRNTVRLKVDGNYIETPATAEVDKLTVKALYPMRSQADVDVDDIAPVAYFGSEVYFTLQEAIDKAKTYVYLMADAMTDAAIPADRKIVFYPYGNEIGTLTNNGELTIYGTDLSAPSKIVNNGTLTLSGSAATVYTIENNGTLKITNGATYDLSRITGSGSVTITGGTFSTQPSAAQLAEWYIAKEQSDQTYKVSKMTVAEAIPYGLVASGGRSGGNYYKSISEGVNTLTSSYTYLQVNSSEDVVVNTQKNGERYLDSNGYSFNGTITMGEGSGVLRLYGQNFTLKRVSGEKLSVGGYSTAATAVIEDADLDTLNVAGSGDCTVKGGNYDNVDVQIYYANKTDTQPKYTAKLSITGGSFANDTVTIIYTNHTLDNGATTETVPLSDYVAAGYTVVAGTGDYPYQVVPQSADAAVVVPAAPSATAPAGDETASNLAAAIEGTGDLVSGSGLDVAANTQANANTVTKDDGKAALEAEKIQVGDDVTVTIVVQPYMDVNIVEVSTDSKTLKLNITPRYNVVATTADLAGDDPEDITVGTNAAVVEGGQELAVTQPVEVKLPLPAGFAGTETTLYVQHETGGKVYYYQGAVSAVSLSFTNAMGFSSGTSDTFTVLGSSTDVVQAGIGDVYYATLQEAVDAAKDGQTVTVLADGLSASVTGEERTILLANGTGSAITVTLNGTPLNVGAGETGEFTYTAPTPEVPSGGGSSVTYYSSTVEQAENGTVTVSPKSASKGTTVTITVTADEGYVLDTITVTDKDGKTVALTDKGNGKYTFTMPTSKVTVKALFKAEPQEALPFTDVAEGAWYYEAVAYAYEKGIMTGTNDGTTFSPTQNLTRGMMARILYNLEGSPDLSDENLGYPFADVPGDAWYADGVYWARQNGIVDGYGNNTFGPEEPITREQMAAILYNYAKFKGEDMTATTDLTSFADDEKVSGWAVYAMKWAVAEKLIQGSNNSLNPLGTATRAEVAQLFMNLLER